MCAQCFSRQKPVARQKIRKKGRCLCLCINVATYQTLVSLSFFRDRAPEKRLFFLLSDGDKNRRGGLRHPPRKRVVQNCPSLFTFLPPTAAAKENPELLTTFYLILFSFSRRGRRNLLHSQNCIFALFPSSLWRRFRTHDKREEEEGRRSTRKIYGIRNRPKGKRKRKEESETRRGEEKLRHFGTLRGISLK